MTQLEDAMQEHMAQIVFHKRRPFTYRDFLHFEVGERQYRMAHGTFRNKISKLMKSEEAELAYNSVLGFYTLKGVEFGRKPMTGTHMGVSPNFPLIR